MSHEVFDRKVDGMICPQFEDEIARHPLLYGQLPQEHRHGGL